MQLRLSGHLSGGVGGVSLSDSELRGLEGLLGEETVGAGGGGGLGAGSGGTVDMLRKVLQEVRADSARVSGQRQGSGGGGGSDGENTRSKFSSSLKGRSNTYSAGTAAQIEFLAGLRGSTSQRGGGGGVSWKEPPAKSKVKAGAGASHRHSNISNASSAQFTNLTSVSASGDVNGSGTSENESSDPGDPVL